MALIYADLVDDLADRPGLPDEQRIQCFEDGFAAVLHGKLPAPSKSMSADEENVLKVGRQIHANYLIADTSGQVQEVGRQLRKDMKRQILSDDAGEQLELSSTIGQNFLSLCAVAQEEVEGQSFKEYRPAVEGYGAYSVLHDHAYEVREDLSDGVKTFNTLYIKQHGDTPANRLAAQQLSLAKAAEEYARGLRVLETPEQEHLYHFMRQTSHHLYRASQWWHKAQGVLTIHN